MMRILVPLDGSDFAERALVAARGLAVHHDAELHLVAIVSDIPPVPLTSANGELATGWFEDEAARIGDYLAEVTVREGGGGDAPDVVTHVRIGPVARSIQDVAREIQADLVVLTTHGRGVIERAWLGSVADQLLRRLERPILLLRPTEGPEARSTFAGNPRHVLVPLDGSKAGESALDALTAVLPSGSDTTLTLVTVIQPPLRLTTTYLPHAISQESLLEEQEAKARRYLDGVADRLRAAGVGSVDPRVLNDHDAAHGILGFCEDDDVELIALSTHGHGGVTRFFLGSVADKIVRGSSIPVLVTRRPLDAG